MIARADAPEGTTAREEAILVIPDFPLPDRRLCGNTRVRALHLAGLRREQRNWGFYLAIHALRRRPPPDWTKGPVGIEFDVFRTRAWAARPLDDDNLIAGLKSARDGVADALRVTDATWRTTAVRWHTTVGGSGGVTITLRPLGEG